ncbi:MAG: AMP-binding protein [Bacteroidota bacterium]|nr:AMP-binding protein [Bacteroidota bacterium]
MLSIPNFFEKYVEQYQSNPLLWEKSEGSFKSTSYKDFADTVRKFAAGLYKLGIKRGERVALLSEGRNDWLMSELGVLYNGAICVPLSVKLNEDSDLLFRLQHSECTSIIVSGHQYKKIERIHNKIPNLKHIILIDKKESELKDIEIEKEGVLALGEKILKENIAAFEERIKSVKPEDFANISYTSGTTSDPKGIVLTHSNYVWNVEQACGLMEIPEDNIMFIILPWDHSFAHTAGLYTMIRKGASIASVEIGKSPMETLRNIPNNIKEVRPHIMLSVPALAKNFKKNIETAIRKKGSKAEKIFNKALKVAYAYNKEGYNKGKGFRLFNYLQYKLYDKILFKKIRENFGGRMKFFVGGGALLDIELQRFFYAIGIPMFQGYGLSESSPVISSNAVQAHKLGSSGFIVGDMELKICDENGKEIPVGEKGEIAIKGPNVMHSYWKNPTATADTVKDGWLYTGDLGYIDNDNFLYVSGRFKSLLIGSDGEKYSPEGIEETIVEHSEILDQIMLHNEQDPYTIALVVINKEKLIKKSNRNNIDHTNENGRREMLKLVSEEFEEYKSKGNSGGMFPERWLPTAFGILEEGFTEENRLLNTSLKMVRRNINSKHSVLQEFLQTPEAKKPDNNKNMEILDKILK